MFSLIITLIAIVLVVAVALAALYYGGTAFQSGDTRAMATRYAVEAEQIQAAITLFRTEHQRLPTSLSELTAESKYLTTAPSQVWTNTNSAFIQTDANKVPGDVCLLFNQGRGVEYVPTCEDPAYRSMVVCCQVTE